MSLLAILFLLLFIATPLIILTQLFYRKKEFSFLGSTIFALLGSVSFFFLVLSPFIVITPEVFSDITGAAVLIVTVIFTAIFFIFSIVFFLLVQRQLGLIKRNDLLVVMGGIALPIFLATSAITTNTSLWPIIGLVTGLIAQAILWTWWFDKRKKYLGIMLPGIFVLAAVIGYILMRLW